ncbi:tRNA(His) guanylyltransferase Thg1 family protein [Actinomadura rudentiformis]|uniref:tRNA(His) guanylyltransferase Thg1 family protein n=1 Tax=Actinomadura rudentiformis TaxID=359158 RepID=UPI001CEF5E40|nr:tRNA(His) guanylyltransferase Thg1 family protein [Actinomadura rudentiformis]
MRLKDLDTRMREREYVHSLTLLPGAWTVVRVDGRGFSSYTAGRFEKPFDRRFSDLMVGTAETLLTELGGRYAYTESDEISVVLDPAYDLFGREVEKLVSLGEHRDRRVHPLRRRTGLLRQPCLDRDRRRGLIDYLSWRQADAARCALNGWCYWTLRKEGTSQRQATRALEGTRISAKNEMLFARGINFNEVPAWQRRGVGLWWETYEKAGRDPVRSVDVTATRRRVRIDRELPMKAEYRELVGRLICDGS